MLDVIVQFSLGNFFSMWTRTHTSLFVWVYNFVWLLFFGLCIAMCRIVTWPRFCDMSFGLLICLYALSIIIIIIIRANCRIRHLEMFADLNHFFLLYLCWSDCELKGSEYLSFFPFFSLSLFVASRALLIILHFMGDLEVREQKIYPTNLVAWNVESNNRSGAFIVYTHSRDIWTKVIFRPCA